MMHMKKTTILLASLAASLCCLNAAEDIFKPVRDTKLRAPAYPLVTIDPYASAWSFSDALNGDSVRHWTGREHPLVGAVRVDGKVYRFMGGKGANYKTIIPMSAAERWDAAYTKTSPGGDWTSRSYDDSSWKRGKAAFGTADMPNVSTEWKDADIWVRRTFELPEDLAGRDVDLVYSHDDMFELYINGIKLIDTGLTWKNNVVFKIPENALATLKEGKNVIAAHCRNTEFGAYVDFGLRENVPAKSFETPAVQTAAHVLPTQTYYSFECGPVTLDVVFTAPLLPDDLELASRPVNYLSYRVKSNDGKPHDVQMYIGLSSLWAVNDIDQQTSAEAEDLGGGIISAKAGSIEQAVLQKTGDDVRIDWGYAYLAAKEGKGVAVNAGPGAALEAWFANTGSVAGASGEIDPFEHAVIAVSENFGKSSEAEGFVMIGYDDLYSIKYFGEDRMAYWKRGGEVSMADALKIAAQDYKKLMKKCRIFDQKLMSDAEKAGNKQYAELCALAYRQAMAAHKLITAPSGELLFISKENFSNGCAATVDITYPSSPMFLVYNPELLKGMMNPIFHLSESGRWSHPFAAHDAGVYPHIFGNVYGEPMPVEESGNMLILTAAIAAVEGSAEYAKKHWDTLTTWANYLAEKGLDPDNQLCTDDFAGHLAHNANLSIKAIMGVASYAKLAGMLGDKNTEKKFMAAAKDMAGKWKEMASDGSHYRLAFDRPGSWSQKYNLVWDRLLGFNVFDPSIAQTESASYLARCNEYGIPLDSRKTYTKSDWIIWSACLNGDKEYFSEMVAPVYKYADETKTRMPLSDWHETTDGNSVAFRARSVVGGYYMKMLEAMLEKRK